MIKTCPICGSSFSGKGKMKFCSPSCAEAGARQARKEWEERTGFLEKQRKRAQDYRDQQAGINRELMEQEAKKKAANRKRADTRRLNKERKELIEAADAGDLDAMMDLAFETGDMRTYYTLYQEQLFRNDREYGIPRNGVRTIGGIDVYSATFVDDVLDALEEADRQEKDEE